MIWKVSGLDGEEKKHSKWAIQKPDTGQLSTESQVCGILHYPTSNSF